MRQRPKVYFMVVGDNNKPKSSLITKAPRLKGLGINLVALKMLYNIYIQNNSTSNCIKYHDQNFKDILTDKFPYKLPLEYEVDHKIKFTFWAEPLKKAPYQFDHTEFATLKGHFTQ